MPDPTPDEQERARAIWRVLSDQSTCSPNTFDTEAAAEAMVVKCDAIDPGEWRVAEYVPATALAQQRERDAQEADKYKSHVVGRRIAGAIRRGDG